MRFYMDTARMGQACPAALQVQCACARLAADDPSLYSLPFLKEGAVVWPVDVQQEFPALQQWQGTTPLKQRFATAWGVTDPNRVFLASQTARLMRIAARIMFRQSTHVLTTDLNWPAWQSLVEEEAQRHGRRVSRVAIVESVLNRGWTAEDIIEHLLRKFREQRCDGLFLPAVSSLGICLPVAPFVQRLKQQLSVRFALIDAAQSFCQMPDPGISGCCDILVTGCHKWLGAHLPMGVAVAGNTLTAEQFRCVIHGPRHSATCDDPLLQLTEQLQMGRVNRYTETVNILPMLSANAALANSKNHRDTMVSEYRQRRLNADLVAECLEETDWHAVRVDDSVRSAILLLRSKVQAMGQIDPDAVQSAFRQQGVALSAYASGLLRLSMPSHQIPPDHLCQLKASIHSVSRQFRAL